MSRRRRVLMLYWSTEPFPRRTAIAHHLRVLEHARTPVEVVYANALHALPRTKRAVRYDAVILHTTFLCMRWSHLFPTWKWHLRWLQDVDALKIALPQDEYDHSEILDEWLYELGVDVVFSNFDASSRALLYPTMAARARFEKALTGYVDAASARRLRNSVRPLGERAKDVVYRAAHLPYWFGSHGQLKHEIGSAAAARGRALGLDTDISTRLGDTILGDAWLEFVASGRAIVGCESGSSVLDRRGEIRARIQWLLQTDPSLSFDEVSRQMPDGWDSYEFFAIGPRHLEAAMTRTAQILVEGDYDGVLHAEEHYVPIARDLSNLDECLERVRDVQAMEAMVERAYADVCASGRYTYATFADALTDMISDVAHERRAPADALLALAPIEERTRATGRRVSSVFGFLGHFSARAARSPSRSLLRVAALGRLMVEHRAARSLVAAYARDASLRSVATADFLVAELVRLAALGAVVQSPEITLRLRRDAPTQELVMETHLGPSSDRGVDDVVGELTAGRVRSVRWTHSAVGRSVELPVWGRLTTSVDIQSGDSHDFRFLGGFAASNPSAASDLLRSIVGGRRNRGR